MKQDLNLSISKSFIPSFHYHISRNDYSVSILGTFDTLRSTTILKISIPFFPFFLGMIV